MVRKRVTRARGSIIITLHNGMEFEIAKKPQPMRGRQMCWGLTGFDKAIIKTILNHNPSVRVE